MKILRISLRNIASLAGEHTVDFTVPPLANTGLFSISGPTGSGKSTLLDALCLALYDETPRMGAVAGASAVEDAGKAIQQGDVRNLLRRGCGEGYAEVAFVGVDGHTYTANWSVRRAGARADRALQNTQHSLFKGNSKNGANREYAADGTRTEVKSAIVAKVGLTFEQFRRAVLLAQGDFASFLKAKDAERAEILQALTGTERFEKISVAVYERHKKEEEMVRELQRQLGAALPLSAEARAEAESALEAAIAVKKTADAALGAVARQLEWFETEKVHRQKVEESFEQVRKLSAEVEANQPRAREIRWIRIASLEAGPKRAAEKRAAEALAEALRRESELIERESVLSRGEQHLQQLLLEHRKTKEQSLTRRRDLAPDLDRARRLDGELVPLAAAADLADKEYTRARQVASQSESDLQSLRAAIEELTAKRVLQEEGMAKWAHWEPFARDLEAWLERLRVEEGLRNKRSRVESDLRATSEKLRKAAERLHAASEAAELARNQFRIREASWKEASEKAAAFNPEQLLAQRRSAIEMRDALRQMRMHLATQARIEAEKRACERQRATLEEEIRTGERHVHHLRTKVIPEAQAVFEQAAESLRLAAAASSEHATILRHALVRGKACPVCGAREHPGHGPEDSGQSAVLDALRKSASTREGELRHREKEVAGEQARLEEKKSRRDAVLAQCGELESSLQEHSRFVPCDAEMAALLDKPEAQRDAELAEREQRNVDFLVAVEAAEAARIDAEKNAKQVRAEWERVGIQLKAAEVFENEARSTYAVAEVDNQSCQREFAQVDVEYVGAREAIRSISEAARGVHLNETPRAIASESGEGEEEVEGLKVLFEREAKAWGAAKRAHDEILLSARLKLEQLPALNSALGVAARVLEQRRVERDAALINLDGRKAARLALLGGRAVDDVEATLAADIESASTAEAAASSVHEDARNRLSQIRALLHEQTTGAKSIREHLNQAGKEMDAWLSEFVQREGCPTQRKDLDAWLEHDVQTLEKEQASLNALERRLAAAREVAENWGKQLDEHRGARLSEDDLETVQSAFLRRQAEAQTAADAVDVQRVGILGDDEKIQQKGALLKSLAAREEQWKPWQKLNALIGSADGSRFRNMAQQWTLEILLKHANTQLAMLSGRYRLERLRDSLNLLVIDREMDGQQRSVHSLSGGESFLVSLGLALGLASLTSSRLLIESLFIDEGFGSLDSETLRVALNALSHLQSQGRKVGVISHVSEMVDAIPVQIRVIRGSGGASRIAV